MKRRLYILSITVLSFVLTSCEDDPLLDETPDTTASGSYGKSTFTDVPSYEELLENEKN